MKAGVIGLPDYDFGPIESYTSERQVDEETKLTVCLEIRDTNETERGYILQKGRAAIQELGTETRIRIDEKNDSINVVEDTNVVNTKYTEFVLVPGEFVAVESGNGVFAFRTIAAQTDAAKIKRANIDLDSLAASYEIESSESAIPWQLGFYGSGGSAEKGVLYGDDVISDAEFGKLVANLPKNQLGLEIDDEEGIKMTATESGYVQVYQPSNYDSKDFSEFVLDHILPHASLED